jgi:hypothetical protein
VLWEEGWVVWSGWEKRMCILIWDCMKREERARMDG